MGNRGKLSIFINNKCLYYKLLFFSMYNKFDSRIFKTKRKLRCVKIVKTATQHATCYIINWAFVSSFQFASGFTGTEMHEIRVEFVGY